MSPGLARLPFLDKLQPNCPIIKNKFGICASLASIFTHIGGLGLVGAAQLRFTTARFSGTSTIQVESIEISRI